MSTHTHDHPATTPVTPSRVELAVGGMTCASCAARIEKKLNRLGGVTATVNFATETATVDYDPATVSTDDLVATVEATGYAAKLPEPPTTKTQVSAGEHEHGEAESLRQRLLVSAALSIPVVAMAMVPVLQFRFWQWISLTLAAPGRRPRDHNDGRRHGRAGWCWRRSARSLRRPVRAPGPDRTRPARRASGRPSRARSRDWSVVLARRPRRRWGDRGPPAARRGPRADAASAGVGPADPP